MKKLKPFIIVSVIYVTVFLLSKSIFESSISNTTYFLTELIQVMPVIFVLTIAIDVWVPKQAITKKLGTGSNIKGAALSFVLGSISAGPIYAAFPITAMLYKKGASIKNIVIIISSWAVIKVPMLANEAKFLGVEFMALRWVLTVVAIYLMGSIASKLVSEKDIIELEEISDSIRIDRSKCISCKVCINEAPLNFGLKSNQVIIIDGAINEEVHQAYKKCPVSAIQIKGEL
jgi:uncharacterized membrane protein YraQ (UPF0718 family)